MFRRESDPSGLDGPIDRCRDLFSSAKVHVPQGGPLSRGEENLLSDQRQAASAELALTEAARVEKQEAPAKEVERLKKQTDDRELARQKNQKSFRP